MVPALVFLGICTSGTFPHFGGAPSESAALKGSHVATLPGGVPELVETLPAQ